MTDDDERHRKASLDDEDERYRKALRDLANHPLLKEFRDDARRRLSSLENHRGLSDARLSALERTIEDRIRSRAALEKRIDDIEQGQERTSNTINKVLWSIGGGTAVTAFLVGLWTIVIQPLLALFGKR